MQMVALLRCLIPLALLRATAEAAEAAEAAPLGPLAAAASEAAALAALRAGGVALEGVEGAEVEALVHRGWHDVVREYVLRSHAAGEAASQRAATQVRQAVQAERNKLDDLIRVLDRNYGKAAEVSPASQWAQNSTHVFLAVKFAQRWNAPGALEVENATVSITSCCFNFTAFGEHSFIRRRYHLSWELFAPLSAEASSWAWAAAGRMSVTFVKEKAANWPRLPKGPTAAPKNLGIWRDMKEKWDKELQKFPPLPDGAAGKAAGKKPAKQGTEAAPETGKKGKAKTKTRKSKADDDDDEDDEAVDREVELLADCPKSSFTGTTVAELCAKSWADVVEQPRVRGRRWLVELYSSQGDGDASAMKKLSPVWRRLADVFPSMVPQGRVGALDCGLEKELCRKLGAPFAKLPQVRRFAPGAADAGEPWAAGALAEASLEALAAFGGGSAGSDGHAGGGEL